MGSICSDSSAAPATEEVRPPPSAVSFEGGGFRAQTEYAALTSALMAAMKKKNPLTTINSSGVFDRFTHIAGVSGGSWLSSSLIYSESYALLIDAMAAAPDQAGKLYRVGWCDKLIASGTGTIIVLPATDIFEAFFPTKDKAIGAMQDLSIFLALYKEGDGQVTWVNIVNKFLQSTAGIGMDVKLGSKVNPWAKGKTWLCCTAVMTPNGSKSGMDEAYIKRKPDGLGSVTYSVTAADPMPLYTPSVFSIVLGDKDKTDAPVPFLAAPIPYQIEYKGHALGDGRHKGFSTQLMGLQGFCENSASLPVVCCASASSADFAFAAMQKRIAWLSNLVGGPEVGAVWASPSVGFEAAHQLADNVSDSKESIDALARASFLGLADAGMCDATGVSYSVAAGAREVLAMCQSGPTRDQAIPEILRLCTGAEPYWPGQELVLPLFEESVAYVREKFAEMTFLAPAPDSKFCLGIQFGTISVTTVPNSWFGIPGSERVTLNILTCFISESIGIGGLQNFQDYATFLQEIIACIMLPGNSASVENSLLPMVLTGKAN